jgi:hypothetical protein
VPLVVVYLPALQIVQAASEVAPEEGPYLAVPQLVQPLLQI